MSIATRPLEDLLPLIAPYAIGCPFPMMEQALRLSAIEFCERTRCWRQIVSRPIRRDTTSLVAPAYATIHEIETATWEGLPLIPTQFSNVQNDIANPVGGGNPAYITQISPGAVTVIPFAEGLLVLSLFLKPKVSNDLAATSSYGPGDDDINVLPEFLLVQHGEHLAAGALHRILSLPGQAYSDLNLAAAFHNTFERGVNTHFARNIKGQQRAPARTRPSYF